MSLGSIFLLLLSLQVFVIVSGKPNPQESSCRAHQTCSSCLQAPDCVWCSAASISKSKVPLVRCVTRSKWNSLKEEWCPSTMVYHNRSTSVTLKDDSFSSEKGKDSVQVRPQKMSLRLRKGDELRLTLEYRQAEDYPVDLYYLMDLSSSMEKYRDDLSKLGLQLAVAMKELTSNFRIGFGSFIDKVVMPMTATTPEKLKSPCYLSDNVTRCAPPYEYKNQMSLTDNVDLFETNVKNAPISGNIDSPEGGLDAMMQVMVCTKEIGWRPKARHLLVFSTDAGFHIAGDGRLAGIVEPNDCLCHLDENGFYSYSLEQDYPSISQIKRQAEKHNMNIIFAVTDTEYETYRTLSARINGSSIGELAENSENVVKLVSEEYKKLKSKVELKDDAPSFIEVRYFSNCSNPSGEFKEQHVCEGRHRPNDTVTFEITVKALECPKDRKDWNRTLQIKPQGVNEILTIDLELLCQCDCEEPGNEGYINNAPECNNRGVSKCGVCSCNSGYFGNVCHCEGSDHGAQGNEETASCKPSNETVVCSGLGHCNCGLCKCFQRSDPNEWYYGKYCECDNFSCQRHKGLICGGPDHGTCDCGTCRCKTGWGGEACGCRNSESSCTPPGDDSKVCNGRGKCVCGSCQCQETDGVQYSGQYCEECPACPGHRCDELKDCVECRAYKLGPLAANGCQNCSYIVNEVDKVVVDTEDDANTDARVCKVPGDAGCTFRFKYKLRKGRGDNSMTVLEIDYEKERDCPRTVNVIGVATGVIAGTVVLGFISLLIWKLLTMAHDQREFAKFEKERAIAKWDRGDNPLYKKATSQFENPTFTENAKD